jgi:uncharacterized membrane protein HdeD (DUF308 family)
MRKLILATLLMLSFSFSGIVGTVFAVDILNNGTAGAGSACTSSDAASSVCKDNNTGGANPITGPDGLLTKITSLVLYVVGAAAVIMVIISGIRMATSSGDEAGFKSARTGLLYALAGLAIAVSARVIVLFILSKL